jgi:hypothetical protein
VNAVHSRQKRERRKIEKDVLQDQCAEIRAKNAILLENNKELEELLETAMSEVAVMERFEATKVNNAAFAEQMRNGPSSAMLQAHFAGLPSSAESMLPEVERGLRASLENQDLSRRMATERDLPGPPDEALQIELRNRVYDSILRSNPPPSRMSQNTHLAGHSMGLGLETPFYEESAAMFGQQQHMPSYSTPSAGGPVWQQQQQQQLDIASASPVARQSLNSWGFLSSPWLPFLERREEEEDSRRRF